MCASKSFDRLAKRAAREDVLKTEWQQCVQENDIEIAGDASMLESVVQHQRIAAELVDGSSSGGHSIRMLYMRHAGQFPDKLQSFIIRAAAGTISTADNSDFFPLLNQLSHNPFDHRRLARAAQR